MSRMHVAGALLGLVFGMHCVWYGQRSVNPWARLLLVPEVMQQQEQRP